MAGLLDYITNSMSGGQMSPEELQASIYAKRAASSAGGLNATRGEATPADLMRIMASMKDTTPAGAMKGATAGVGLNEALNNPMTMPPTSNTGQMPDLEALRLQSLKNAFPYSLYRPSGAYQSPQNTMQNIVPELGGISARNTQPPMDMNMLLRLLGR
jgi:hypothetical protein